jgi:alginate O-acetyltransferase complex protein AlgI
VTAVVPHRAGRRAEDDRRPARRHAAEVALLLASLLVCGWLDRRALFLVLLVTTSDYLISTRLAAAPGAKARRALLSASVAIDTGVLLLWPAAALLPGPGGLLGGILFSPAGHVQPLVPVGVSFLTLRSLGFVIDVYRGGATPCASWMRFAVFLSFFPAFVAGPIGRGSQLLPQFERGIAVHWNSLVEGSCVFVQGLAKKMLIADRLATIADPVFAAPELYPPWTVAAGLAAYSLQIYCDFAGYSDMAIGAARMIGIELPRNFDMPYLATNIGEFWRRWHISLSTWLRDYVFLPVAYAGSRKVEWLGLQRRQEELLNYAMASILTMLLAGLWHGAGWGFLLWGGAHGCALATHRLWKTARRRMPSWLGGILTFVFVSLAWVPFRAETATGAVRFYRGLLGWETGRTYAWFPSWLPWCAAAIAAGHLVTRWIAGSEADVARKTGSRLMKALGLTVVQRPLAGAYLVPARLTVLGGYVMTLFVLSIFLFAPSRIGPFVYAAF